MRQKSQDEIITTSESALHFGPFRADATKHLWRGDQVVHIRPRPLKMLRYLAERPGQLVTKEELLKRLWPGIYVTKTVLKVCAREIRQALDDDATTPQFLETVGTQGYRFIGAVQSLLSHVQHPEEASTQQQEPSLSSLHASHLKSHASFFVGRRQELDSLHTAFTQAQGGKRQFTFVSGEAGVGKTTLVDRFLEQVQASGPVRIGRGQCLSQYGPGEAYLPVLEALAQLCHGADGKHVIAALRRTAPTWLVQLSSIVEAAEMAALRRHVNSSSPERMLREFAEALDMLAAGTPMIFVLEDLQWSDVSTLELIAYLAQRRERAWLQVVGTYRSTDAVVSGNPLRRMVQTLYGRGQCEDLALELLSEQDIEEYLQRWFPQSPIVHTLSQVIHDRTDGNALFMTSFVEDLLRKEMVAETNGQWELRAEVATISRLVPVSVQRYIANQLADLGTEEQLLLGIAAVAGMTFSAAEVAGATERDLEDVEEMFETLANRKQFIETQGLSEWPDGTVTAHYGFRHALYQYVVYRQLGQAQQVRRHRQLVEWLVAAQRERTHEIASKLAVHCEQGRNHEQALRYRAQAGENALSRSAYSEVLVNGRAGLALLAQMPDTPEHRQLELKVRRLVSIALTATKGYGDAELEHNFQRTEQIFRELGDDRGRVPAIIGLTRLHLTRATRAVTEELIAQEYHLTTHIQDPHLLVQLHAQLTTTEFFRGRHSHVEEHYQHVQTLYDPRDQQSLLSSFVTDPLATALGVSSMSLSLAGKFDQGWSRLMQGLAHAEALGQGLTLATYLIYAVTVKSFCGEPHEAWQFATKATALAREYGLSLFVIWGELLQRCMALQDGEREENIEAITTGLTAYRATGLQLIVPYFLSFLAEGYRRQGKIAEALQVVQEALSLMATNLDVFWEAELYRIKGELVLQSTVRGLESQVTNRKSKIAKSRIPNPQSATEAEACFHKAIEVARQQGAKLLELRAAMSLVRLRQQQALEHRVKSREHETHTALAEAHHMLFDVYNWFTEGGETKDLQDAKLLLASLT